MRTAFTLIEVMIVSLLMALIVLFLYQSVAQLRQANTFFGTRVTQIEQTQKIVRVLFDDLALAIPKTMTIDGQNKQIDRLFFQSEHSIHRRVHPYIGYFMVKKHLWRIESYLPITYPLNESDMDVDDLGEFSRFRVYATENFFLVNMQMATQKEQLFKVRALLSL